MLNVSKFISILGVILLGVTIDISLHRNRPEIAIDSYDASGTPDYIFKIKSAMLHCPIGRLSSEVFTKYELALQKRQPPCG